MFKTIRENPRAVTYAVLMHLVLLALLVIGLDWTPKITPSGHKVPIDAELVSPDALPPAQPPRPAVDETQRKAAEAAKRKAEEQRKAELEAQQKAAEQAKAKAAAEARRKVEAQRKAELEAKKKAEVLAQRKAAEAAKKKAQAEAKKQAEEQAKAKAAAEAKARAQAEAKKQAEAEARRKAEAELQAQLAAEQEAARAQSALEQYIPYIQQRVNDNWIRPPGSPQGLVCVVRVQLIPGGTVAGATVTRSSGDPVFDRSVETAVLKASPLPLPPDPSLFDHFREINFKFSPGR
jgi:colicin import membrane protein